MRAVSITPRNPRFPAYPGCPAGRRGLSLCRHAESCLYGPHETRRSAHGSIQRSDSTNGDKIIVNIEEIRVMQRFPTNTTTIHFAADHGVQISETPNDLMMSKQHWSR